jgi:hypothetical protein
MLGTALLASALVLQAGALPATAPPAVHRAAFRDRAAMVLVDAGNDTWAAFNPRTAGFDLVWRGDVDWRGKVFDFSQETSRPRGEVIMDRTAPIAVHESVTIAPGASFSLACPADAATPPLAWHALLVAFDEQVRQPVEVRVLEADGTERMRFQSSTNVSSDREWQWNFKSMPGPALPATLVFTNRGTLPKPLRNIRLEGERVAWSDRAGAPLEVTWRGYEPQAEGVVLRFDLRATDGTTAAIEQRVVPAGRGMRIETSGIPAGSGWTSSLGADPRSVDLGVEP